MQIYVPSRGRPTEQHTSSMLDAAGVPHVVVRTAGDDSRYPEGRSYLVVEAQNIGQKRQAIMDRVVADLRSGDGDGKFVMIDDDIAIDRVMDKITVPASASEVASLFSRVERLLDEYPIVGVATRWEARRITQPLAIGEGKMITFLAYNVRAFEGWNTRPRWDRLSTCEDVDFTMQLLYEGLPRVMVTDFCTVEMLKHGAPGGCSTWRDRDLEIANNRRLHDLWPRHTVLARGDTTVRVLWKKLAKDGRDRR